VPNIFNLHYKFNDYKAIILGEINLIFCYANPLFSKKGIIFQFIRK